MAMAPTEALSKHLDRLAKQGDYRFFIRISHGLKTNGTILLVVA